MPCLLRAVDAAIFFAIAFAMLSPPFLHSMLYVHADTY